MNYQKCKIDRQKTGNLIMSAIAESKLSYEKIAIYLELTSSRVIYDWVNGKKLPSLENMANLALILNKSITDLISFK